MGAADMGLGGSFRHFLAYHNHKEHGSPLYSILFLVAAGDPVAAVARIVCDRLLRDFSSGLSPRPKMAGAGEAMVPCAFLYTGGTDPDYTSSLGWGCLRQPVTGMGQSPPR